MSINLILLSSWKCNNSLTQGVFNWTQLVKKIPPLVKPEGFVSHFCFLFLHNSQQSTGFQYSLSPWDFHTKLCIYFLFSPCILHIQCIWSFFFLNLFYADFYLKNTCLLVYFLGNIHSYCWKAMTVLRGGRMHFFFWYSQTPNTIKSKPGGSWVLKKILFHS